MVEDVARATRFSGVGNIDARRSFTTGEIVLLECNPRVYASIALAALAGTNHIAVALDVADGVRPLRRIEARPCVVATPRLIPSALWNERSLRVLAGRGTWIGLAMTVADPIGMLPANRPRRRLGGPDG